MGALPITATRMAQIISGSPLSTAARSSKTSKWPPNTTNLVPTAAIPKRKLIPHAACACLADVSHAIALSKPLRIRPLRWILPPFRQNSEPLEGDGDGDGDGGRLLSSFRRMKTAALAVFTSANPASVGKTIQRDDSSVVQIELDSETNPITVTRARNPTCAALIDKESAILTAMKHPLVLEIRARIAGRTPSIVTEFVESGSLGNFITADGHCRFRSPNRIAKVIAGIALVMRFVHFCGFGDRSLNPADILLDLDWSVRIANVAEHFARRSAGDPL
jgi:serine/threonine protein kinase